MYDLLKKHFGFDAFRGPQEAVITRVSSGKDALVIMPTGGGKSLCYQLPALMRGGTTLVISPLVSLMKDQVDALRAHGIMAAAINASLSQDEMETVTRQARTGRLNLLYVAPERLATSYFRNLLGDFKVSLIAVDEAHCISEWGHDFRPDYRQLSTLREILPGAPIVALTATATEAVQEDILKQLKIHRSGLFVSGFDRPNLRYVVMPKKGAFETTLKLLERHNGESAIIYCLSRKRTEEVANELKSEGIRAEAYHAGLDQKVRAAVQDQFIKDQIQVVVATVAFGMGIDKPDVRLVIHYDLPKSIEGYYQETGRAGRDGLPSECFLLYSYGDTRTHNYFLMKAAPKERALGEEKLKAMVSYCDSRTCRRAFLLAYFGQPTAGLKCGNCDICLGWKIKSSTSSSASPSTVLKKKETAASELSASDAELFERLRALRKQLAEDRGVPPYVIFGDKSLLQMVADKPKTKDAFAEISGVGAQKLKELAELFLDEIKR